MKKNIIKIIEWTTFEIMNKESCKRLANLHFNKFISVILFTSIFKKKSVGRKYFHTYKQVQLSEETGSNATNNYNKIIHR